MTRTEITADFIVEVDETMRLLMLTGKEEFPGLGIYISAGSTPQHSQAILVDAKTVIIALEITYAEGEWPTIATYIDDDEVTVKFQKAFVKVAEREGINLGFVSERGDTGQIDGIFHTES